MHTRGTFVQRDWKEAVNWYRRGAKKGEVSSLYMLGASYRHGRGVDRNPKQAVKFFRRVAARGNYRAVSDLGEMFKNGDGVKRNPAHAVFWYGLGASAGRAKDAAAMNKLLDGAKPRILEKAQALRESFLSAVSDRARGRFLRATS